MKRDIPIAAGILTASILGGMALRMGDYGTVPWMVSRASGLVAFALLTGSMVLGLLISTKAGDGVLSRPFVFTIHQFISVITLTFLGVHAGSLLFDGFLHFTVASLLVPALSPYKPLWVGMGVVSAWVTAIVTASFWMRSRIGQKAWRKLHYASFVAYVGSLVHGAMSGTDTSNPVIAYGYVLSAALVAGLLAYRIAASSEKAAAPPPARRVPGTIDAR